MEGAVTLQLLKRGQNRKVEVKNLIVQRSQFSKASFSGEATRKEMLERQEQKQ